MTKTGFEFFPVQFRIFSKYTGGKNKGKPNPETFHTLTLMRLIDYNNPGNTESVGTTLKRAKTMIDQAHTSIVLTNPGKETDFERAKRYERGGLEVVPEGAVADDRNHQSRAEAGDETFVAPATVADAQIEGVAA